MKSNLEINLKFWLALIATFLVVLSIHFYDYLDNNHFAQHIYVTGLIVCFLLFIGISIDLLLRNNELKSKLNKEQFFKDISMQTIEDYETQIKDQEDHIKELKKSFEDAVVEITELRSKNEEITNTLKVIIDQMHDHIRQIKYWKERALHLKHTKKEVDSEWWECITDVYSSFTKGEKYKKVKSKLETESLIKLICNDDMNSFLVKKSHFKPVTNGN